MSCMRHIIQFMPLQAILYCAREWLSQQSKSEAGYASVKIPRCRQSFYRLKSVCKNYLNSSAENTRLRGLFDTPLIIDGRMEIAEVIGTDADPLRHIIVINRG